MSAPPHELIIGKYGLRSAECYCGCSKVPNHSFCVRCYRSLTSDVQRDLYRRMGDGYEAAHAEALQQLRASGRVSGDVKK